MKRSHALLAILATLAGAGSALLAQQPQIQPAAVQIATAVLPAPADLRASATVHGYSPSGEFVTLRTGTGPLVCLATDPKATRFHVACYHKDLEPFMERGRSLRKVGVTGGQVDTVRFAEIAKGTLDLPRRPMVLYSITAPSYDYSANNPATPRGLFVVYVPFATAATTGLTDKATATGPWVMYPGTAKAHIMFNLTM